MKDTQLVKTIGNEMQEQSPFMLFVFKNAQYLNVKMYTTVQFKFTKILQRIKFSVDWLWSPSKKNKNARALSGTLRQNEKKNTILKRLQLKNRSR